MTKEHLNVYIQKEDSIYLKGWAILIMVYYMCLEPEQ